MEDVPEYQYTVEPLPPGRLGRRYRWQLWRGERLVTSGWHFSERKAMIALRTAGSRAAHRRLGLHALRPEHALADRPLRPGASFRVTSGTVACLLVPRPVETGRQARAA